MTFIIKGKRHVFSKKQVERALVLCEYDSHINEILSGNFDYTEILTNEYGMVENITIKDFINYGYANPDYGLEEQNNWEDWLSNLDRTKQGAYIVEDGDGHTAIAILLKKAIYGFHYYDDYKNYLVLDQDWVMKHNLITALNGVKVV